MSDEGRPPDAGDPAPAPTSEPFVAADGEATSLPDPAVAVPADPTAYDSERSAAARKRGLATPYVPGGRDPDLAKTEQDERRLLRWLLLMVVVIVLAGFVLGMLAAMLGLNGLVGIPT